MRVTVVASMRNEGPFIVEWVTWYRMLGFSDVVVVTNNCTDRSPELLDALQAAGWVHHLRHDVAPGQRITHQKLAAATQHKAVRRADWALVCDVDEFLVNMCSELLKNTMVYSFISLLSDVQSKRNVTNTFSSHSFGVNKW